jgi:hypothetical protein
MSLDNPFRTGETEDSLLADITSVRQSLRELLIQEPSQVELDTVHHILILHYDVGDTAVSVAIAVED